MALLVDVPTLKEQVTTLSAIPWPATATDDRVTTILTRVQDEVLAAYGVTLETDLSAPRVNAAKTAIIHTTIGELLLAFFPTEKWALDAASERRRRARECIDRSLSGASGATPSRSKLGVGLT